MSIWDNIANAAGHLVVGVVDAVQDLAMDPVSGSMKAELIILARKSQRKKAPRGNGPSRAALRRRGLVEPCGDTLTRRGWNWYKSLEADGDVASFLRANDIDPWKDDLPSESPPAESSPADVPGDRYSSKQKARPSKAKLVSQKSYYRWLHGCLLRMKGFEAEQSLLPGEHSVWTIIAEEELLALESLNPLLDMDDIRKSKELAAVREALAAQALPVLKMLSFDFAGALDGMPGARKTGIRACKAGDPEYTYYPIISERDAATFRRLCSHELQSQLQQVLPSLR
ncbi:MAG: hypothetical protein NTV57_18815 [Cyanobacteria bacterium]|nr:hypothetical protein [Cyanobacteriota bacterium]